MRIQKLFGDEKNKTNSFVCAFFSSYDFELGSSVAIGGRLHFLIRVNHYPDSAREIPLTNN